MDEASHADQTQALLKEFWPRVFTGTVASLATVDHSNGTTTASAPKPIVVEDATDGDSELKALIYAILNPRAARIGERRFSHGLHIKDGPMRTT